MVPNSTMGTDGNDIKVQQKLLSEQLPHTPPNRIIIKLIFPVLFNFLIGSTIDTIDHVQT